VADRSETWRLDSDSSSRITKKFNGGAAAEKWPSRTEDGDNFSAFGVAQVFFLAPVGELPKRFSHVQKPDLVHRVLHALGKAHAFRGVSTVIDN